MGIVAQKLATKGKERDFFAFRGGGMEREDEICSGADAFAHLGVSVSNLCRQARPVPGLGFCEEVGAGKQAFRHPLPRKNAAPCGAAPAFLIALRGEDEIIS